MFLALLGTAANHQYIFASNKLREQIGAAEHIYRSCTQYVLSALKEIGGPDLWCENTKQLRQNLSNISLNPPLEHISKPIAEVLLMSGGCILVFFRHRQDAIALVRKVTLKTLKLAPELNICGVVTRESFDPQGKIPLYQMINELRREHEYVQGIHNSAQLRHCLYPIVESCHFSRRPVSYYQKENGNWYTCSQSSLAKIKASELALMRYQRLYPELDFFSQSMDEIERRFRKLDWTAVILVAVNDIAEIVSKFHDFNCANSKRQSTQQLSVINNYRQFLIALRGFTIALDQCVDVAYQYAIRRCQASENSIFVVPLLSNQGQFTLIADAYKAMGFARSFLEEFEKQAQQQSIHKELLKSVALKGFKYPYLTACAGVAIFRSSYPYAIACSLADQLLRSAKSTKYQLINKSDQIQSCSALDFHVLNDSLYYDLTSLRRSRSLANNESQLTARPYIVTAQEKSWLRKLIKQSRRLLRRRHICMLERAVFKIRQVFSYGQSKLVHQQLSILRYAIFRNLGGVNHFFKQEVEENSVLENLLRDKTRIPSFLYNASLDYRARLLDALEIAEFWSKDN